MAVFCSGLEAPLSQSFDRVLVKPVTEPASDANVYWQTVRVDGQRKHHGTRDLRLPGSVGVFWLGLVKDTWSRLAGEEQNGRDQEEERTFHGFPPVHVDNRVGKMALWRSKEPRKRHNVPFWTHSRRAGLLIFESYYVSAPVLLPAIFGTVSALRPLLPVADGPQLIAGKPDRGQKLLRFLRARLTQSQVVLR